MQIGIGLPGTIPGTEGRDILEWARRADQRGFSTLGVLDRLVYANYEPLTMLTAAAAVTSRIRLTTSVLLAPVRANTALFAKQAASLDRLSNGRLTLGLAVGNRADDYEAGGLEYHRRGRGFDRQLEELKRIWSGEERGSAGGVGPEPVQRGGPPIMVGGSSDATFRRVVTHGIGWMAGAAGPGPFVGNAERARKAWQDAGREGTPRLGALCYFALGPNGRTYADRFLLDYYATSGAYAERVAKAAVVNENMAHELIASYTSAGCDELIFFPCNPSPDQVDALAAIVLGHASA